MSSDPPPWLSSAVTAPASGPISMARPRSGWPSSFCTARANVWSASSHCGRPTALMLVYMVSAIGRLKCCGHALPMTRDVTSVLVINAAPWAMRSAMARSAAIRA
jgi:hypothetical protein